MTNDYNEMNIAKELQPTTASMLLGQARDLLDQRAKDYDKPGGERSMGTVAKMFNLATKREGEAAISESEAWLIMDLLKIVRDRHTPHGHQDSCEDHVSYAALYGEARLREKWEAPVAAACPPAPAPAPMKPSKIDMLISDARIMSHKAARLHRDILGVAATKGLLLEHKARKVVDLEDEQCLKFAIRALLEITNHAAP